MKDNYYNDKTITTDCMDNVFFIKQGIQLNFIIYKILQILQISY